MRRSALILPLMLAATAMAQLPDGLTFDDGFTWFECKNQRSVENNVAIGRWTLVSSLRIWGKVPDRSGWKVVIKKEGKALAEYITDGFPLKLAGGPPQGLVIVGFWKDKPLLDADGLLDVEVYYIDGGNDKEHLARTCKLDVRRAERVRGGPGSREADAADFYVNRHSEVLSSILYFRGPEFPSYTQIDGLTYYSDRMVELLLNYSENANFAGPKLGRVRIEVDGKEVEMKVPNNEKPQDEMGFGELGGKYNVEYSDRNAEKYFKGGPAYQERIGFCRRVMMLPLHWGPKPEKPLLPSKVYTNDHPGEWKVTYLIERKPVRIWRFKIGPDGLPLPHPEQAKGLSLALNAVLADTEIPSEGGEFDGRLSAEFVKQGAFFGRPWATDEMKKAAEKTPTKGAPFPTPSDKQ
ncbi:hypothetical protein RAS1_05410 [Phycisphaerae bacterium RAS1]|nr:hypothetical protein RAS1_05410 [Phycisphaerae bacterium RAS1]